MKISHRLNKVVGVLLIVRVFVPPVAIILLGWAAVDIYLSVSAEIDKAISDLKSSLQPISDAFGAIKDAIDWTGVDFPSFNPIKVSNLITNPLAKFKTKVE
ncbi:MAG: hypothetical protein KDL87_13550, partial [Verrucomicrobiae bacterium]|nr:hypothetical protein [Verrucomicrobiae bacterium]